MNERNEDFEVSFTAETGELYSLDKKERLLVREVLRLGLSTPAGKKALEERFSKEGFKIAVNLLEQMGVRVTKPK